MEIPHQETHENFVQTILNFKNELAVQSLDSVVRNALSFLTRWLASHILETDRHFAYVVLALKAGYLMDAAKKLAIEQLSGATRLLRIKRISTLLGSSCISL